MPIGRFHNPLLKVGGLVRAHLVLGPLLALFLTASCTEKPAEPLLRVGTNNWFGYEPIFIAETMGFFDPHTVHVVETPLSMGLVQAFRGTTIDAAGVSLSRAITWANDGLDIVVILVLDSSQGADVIMARPQIKSFKDLTGHSVGAELDTVNGYLMMRALEKHQMTSNQIQIRDIPNDDLIDAYQRGEIDAAPVFGASKAKFEKAGAHEIFNSSMIPGEIIDVLVVRKRYLENYPHHVESLVKGWIKARQLIATLPDIQEWPQGALKEEDRIRSHSGVHLTEITENTAFLAADGQKLKELIKKRQALSSQLGLIPAESRIPEINGHIYLAALEAANQENE